MTSPDPTSILGQINSAREQTYQNIATAQGILAQANAAASAAAQDRAAIQAIAQQTVSVDTSVGTRVFAGDTMIHGDTGTRRLSDGVGTNQYVSSRRVELTRLGPLVSLTFECRIEVGFQHGDVFLTLPSGFRPAYQIYIPKGYANQPDVYTPGGTGNFHTYTTPTSTTWLRNILTYPTKEPWPTSLPGSPV